MEEEIFEKLDYLKGQHRDLDEEISTMMRVQFGDQLAVQRMKKKKLEIRDKILKLESMLQPDMIA